jgi:hypothetical protein
MRDERYCFFHRPERTREARRRAEHVRQRWFESVDLNDSKAVQKALWEVMQRTLDGRIEQKRAAEILNKLRASAL